jgi:hypothetical protein
VNETIFISEDVLLVHFLEFLFRRVKVCVFGRSLNEANKENLLANLREDLYYQLYLFKIAFAIDSEEFSLNLYHCRPCSIKISLNQPIMYDCNRLWNNNVDILPNEIFPVIAQHRCDLFIAMDDGPYLIGSGPNHNQGRGRIIAKI